MSFEIRVECMECGAIRFLDAAEPSDGYAVPDFIEDHEHTNADARRTEEE